MKGAPPTKHEVLDQVNLVVRTVDQRGREMDQRWGIGRLPALVPIEVAQAFRRQQRKFSAAVWEYDAAEVEKHGQAMIRAYGKLDELAVATHGEPGTVEQWEVESEQGLIILVRDIADTARAQLHGRQAQVWSLDEIASVIRAHPVLAAAKSGFPGAVVESVRPPMAVKHLLDDELTGLPF